MRVKVENFLLYSIQIITINRKKIQVNISLSGPSKLENLGRCSEGGTNAPCILEEGGTDVHSVIEEGEWLSLASLKRVNFLTISLVQTPILVGNIILFVHDSR